MPRRRALRRRAAPTTVLTVAGLIFVAPAASATQSVGTFAATSSLGSGTTLATATLLPDGDVLVAGGEIGIGSGAASSGAAELYDPTSGNFTTTGALATSRYEATASPLANGDVLVAGGLNGTGSTANATSTAELYVPSTGTFTTTGALPSAVFGAAAVTLSGGDVLIVGGDTGSASNPTPSSQTFLYNPTAGTFNSGPALNAPRAFATLTALSDGDALVAGGTSTGGVVLSSAELFHAASNTMTLTPGSMQVGRSNAVAALLGSGKVLVAGGDDATGTALSDAELFDPGAGTFSSTGALNVARGHAVDAVLPDGDILVAGGKAGTSALGSSELYSATQGVFTTNSTMTTPRSDAALAPLLGGGLLVVGGTDSLGDPQQSAETYVPGVPPLFTGAPTANFSLGIASTVTLVASGDPAPTITETGVLPGGLSFSATTPGSAEISGTPSVEGSFLVHLAGTNGVTPAEEEALTVVVGPSPAPAYALAAQSGTLFPFGGVTGVVGHAVPVTRRPMVAFAAGPKGTGQYLVTSRGNVYNLGGAPYFGSPASKRLPSAIAAFALTPDGLGYWLAARDGTVYGYGDATVHGHLKLNVAHRAVVGISPGSDDQGYYVATASGNLYNEGDAPFYGSAATARLDGKVVAVATTPTGKGYFLATSGGQVFAYGDALAVGDLSSTRLRSPVVAFVPTVDAKGYYLATAAGNVYNKGDAPFYGSQAGTRLPHPVIGVAVLG